ncbi:MAG: hypothetical protein GY864_10730 [Desulfobacterales bacterium]|nr:hypothetical protein [Desulfobacterales bacterium]
MKKNLASMTIFGIVTFYAHITCAATPFSAPAEFDLSGSTIDFSVVLAGGWDTSLAPNPAPVTGSINIETINRITGAFTGEFADITASTTATLPSPVGDIDIICTINSDDLSGWFVWAMDKVIFRPDTINATFSIGGESFNVPFNGVHIPVEYKDGVISATAVVEHSGVYDGTIPIAYDATLVINLTGNLADQSNNGPWVELKTNSNAYVNGDTLQLYFGIGNPGTVLPVDLYLGLLGPNGALLTAPGYTGTIGPIISNFPLPGNFSIPSILVYGIPLTAITPPISSPGAYLFWAVLTEPGNLNLLSEFALAPFEYGAAVSHPYDGTWDGSADSHSDLSEGDCSGFSDVDFTITNSKIVGTALDDEEVGYTVTGYVDPDGTIKDGTISVEGRPVGYFDGIITGTTISGTWLDIDVCYGPYEMTKD